MGGEEQMRPITSAAVWLVLFAAVLPSPLNSAEPEEKPAGLLFRESFDDARLAHRKWYDGDKFSIAKEGAKAGDGCLEFRWLARGTTPNNSHGARRLFEPSETIYLRCYLRLSRGWGW